MDKFVPSAKKAMEDKEQRLKVPSRYADIDAAMGGQQLLLPPQHQAPNISEMKPVTREAYGGGMYAHEGKRDPIKPRASATQSADGPEEPAARPQHTPPPSTGDRDLDITGQSYIQ